MQRAFVVVIGCSCAASACRTSQITVPPTPAPETSGPTSGQSGGPPADVTVKLAPEPLELHMQPGTVAGTVTLAWPPDARVALTPPQPIQLAAPAEPLRGELKVVGPAAIRLEAPPDGLRARFDAVEPIVATLRTEGPLKTQVDLNMRMDPATVTPIQVAWGTPPSVRLEAGSLPLTITATLEKPVGWVVLFALMVVAALLALLVKRLAGKQWWMRNADTEREPIPRTTGKDFIVTFLATLAVPMLLDLSGRSVMKDLSTGAGVMFVFFSYCFVAATLGGQLLFPLLAGFEIVLARWAATGSALPPAASSQSARRRDGRLNL